MKKTNDKYWNEREAEDLLLESEKTTETAIDKIQRLYEDTTKEINKSLEKTFKGYARRNEITEAEATEYLSNAQRLDHIEYLENELLIATEEEKKRLIPQYNAIATNYRLSRLETLKSDLVVKLNRLAMAEVFINADNYKKVAKNLDKKIITYTAKTLEVDGMSGINSNVIDEIVNARWYGKNYSERVWSNRDKLEQVLNEQIKQGIAKGTSIRYLSKDLSETMDVGMYPAVRLIRTETAFVHGQITLEEYKQMGVEEYRYIATLDKRTSKICRELDYKIYKVKDAKVGKNFPPMHPNCRSTTVPASEHLEDRVAKDYITDENYYTKSISYDDYEEEQEVKHNIDAEAERRKYWNIKRDKEQHKKYKEFYGKIIPAKFEEFQDMKYNNYRYNRFKNYYVMTRREMLPKDLSFELYESNLNATGFEGWTAVGFNPQYIEQHKKHLQEFGLNSGTMKDWETYEEEAVKFLNNAKKYEHFISAEGTRFVYDEKSNRFALARRNGITQTYYKPKRKRAYWLKQVEKYQKEEKKDKK